jgi:hypothetical protein
MSYHEGHLATRPNTDTAADIEGKPDGMREISLLGRKAKR